MTRWLRQHRRLLLVPLLAWLLGQFAMTGVGAAATSDGTAMGVPGVDTIIICTPNGLRTIALADIADADGEGSGGEHPIVPERGYCAWCQAAGSVLQPSPMLQAMPCLYGDGVAVGPKAVIPLVRSYTAADGFLSRAPPFGDVSTS